MLSRAVREGWSDEDLRFAVQELSRSKRGGVGGRPRRVPGRHGAEVTLRQMGRLCRRLTAYFDAAWSDVGDNEWAGLVSGCAAGEREKLLQDLGRTRSVLAAAAKACEVVRRRVAALQQAAGRG